MSFLHDHSVPAPGEPAAPQPPSTPSEVSESSSLPRTPQSFVEQSPPDTPDGRKLGSLHLQPATVEDLFNIDRFIYGDYELVDGLLIYKDIMESDRNKEQVKHLQYRFKQREQLKPTSNLIATVEASVAIPSKRYLRSQPSSSNDAPLSDDSDDSSTPRRGNPNYSVVSADLAISAKLSDEQRSRLSPGSQNITFPLNHPPQFVLESSSTNESNDTKEKPKLYARAKVPTYSLINNRARAKHPIPAVHVGKLHNGRYEGLEKPHRGTDKVNLGPIGTLVAKNCIKPGNVDDIMNREGREQRLRREEAEKGREEEKDRRKQAESKMRAEKKMHREREAKMKSKLQAKNVLLRQAGIPVTDSSSSSSSNSGSSSSGSRSSLLRSSPPRKKRK